MTFKNSKIVLLSALIALGNSGAGMAETYEGPKLGEPEYTVNDRNHVSVSSEVISYSLSDISIGSGSMALTHHIAINANDALNFTSLLPGYKEKYQGGMRRVVKSSENNSTVRFEVIAVFDEAGSTEFTIDETGTFVGLANQLTTLTVVDSLTFALTRPDGTVVTFTSRNAIPSPVPTDYEPRAYMSKIDYPNGFSITIHRDGNYMDSPIKSVTSNNGLQLKYIYDVHSRPLAASKQSATNNPEIVADSLNWSSYHPSKIIALNNAVETCPLLGNTCSTTHDWPEVNYSWPDGMPRAFYVGESVFSVIDAEGRTTEFHHTALSRGLKFGDSGVVVVPELLNWYFPRITRLIESSGAETTYGYQNFEIGTTTAKGIQYAFYTYGIGTLLHATKNGVKSNYAFGPITTTNGTQSEEMVAWGDAYKGVERVITSAVHLQPGEVVRVPFLIETWDKIVHLSKDYANNVTLVENKLNGITTEYNYDALGRLESTDVDGIKTEANFPSTYCSTKTCNKPTSVSNNYLETLKEEATYTNLNYVYATGQIKSARTPANNQGLIARKEFVYQEHSAKYLNEEGELITSSEPISLLSSEFYCENSSVDGTTCTGKDKVETTYEYGSGETPNNLLLLGATTISEKDNLSRTVCFKYDKYGNQIEQSSPKSGITDCNIGRGY